MKTDCKDGDWVSVAEASKRCGYSVSAILWAVRRGWIVAYRPKRRAFRVSLESVWKYVHLDYRPDKSAAIQALRDWFEVEGHGSPFDLIDDLYVAYRNSSGARITYQTFGRYVCILRKERGAVLVGRKLVPLELTDGAGGGI